MYNWAIAELSDYFMNHLNFIQIPSEPVKTEPVIQAKQPVINKQETLTHPEVPSGDMIYNPK